MRSRRRNSDERRRELESRAADGDLDALLDLIVLLGRSSDREGLAAAHGITRRVFHEAARRLDAGSSDRAGLQRHFDRALALSNLAFKVSMQGYAHPWVQEEIARLLRRPNPDETRRGLERRAADDPAVIARLTADRWRRGEGLPAWFAANLAPRGVDERDLKAMLAVLARGFHWRDNRVLGPRQWSWLCVIDPEGQSDFYVTAVRERTRSHTGPDEYSPVIVIGSSAVTPMLHPDAPRRGRVFGVHPRQAWEELQGFQDGADMPSGGYRVDVPEHYYTSFESRFWRREEAERGGFLRYADVLPSARGDVAAAHGCETHGPDPCHADLPTGMMFRWARTPAPDRLAFPVEEVRLYCGLDPLTGLPPEAEKRSNIGMPEEDPFDRVIRILEPLRGKKGFEIIHGTNDPERMDLVRDVIAEWGPFPGLLVRDRGRSLGIGTQDAAVMIEFVRALKRVHQAGVPLALELFNEMTSAIQGKA